MNTVKTSLPAVNRHFLKDEGRMDGACFVPFSIIATAPAELLRKNSTTAVSPDFFRYVLPPCPEMHKRIPVPGTLQARHKARQDCPGYPLKSECRRAAYDDVMEPNF
jgi:hypothetical protein